MGYGIKSNSGLISSTLINRRGQSLIQVMIAASITMILMLAIIQSQILQIRENKAIFQKLSSLEFQRSITLALSTGSTCSANMFAAANLVVPGSFPFDATGLPYIFSLNSLPSSGSGGNLATAGAPVSPQSNDLVILASTGIQVEITSLVPPTGKLHIHFDQSRLTRSIHDLEFPISLSIVGPVTATSVSNCSGGGGTPVGAIMTLKTPWYSPGGGPAACVLPICPVGWTATATSTEFTAVATGAGAGGGNCSQICVNVSPIQVMELKTPWYSPGGGPAACVPPICPFGWTATATSTEFTAIATGAGGGNCSQICVK